MSIVNEPKYKNGLLMAIREQLEHRALWMYLLCDEAKKKGLEPQDYAPAAIKRCGLYQGAKATGTLTIVDTKGTGYIDTKMLNIYCDGGALHVDGVTMWSEEQQNIGYATTSTAFNDKNIMELT